MKLVSVIVIVSLLAVVLASVSNINLGPTGNYPTISTKGGLYVSVTILIYMIFAELGYLPYRFKGKKKRSALPRFMSGNLFMDRNSALKMARTLDTNDCLLRFLCELEACRRDAEANKYALDPDLESDLILLKVAKRDKHPAIIMREDPGSPALPFEIAVHTGSEGLDSCFNLFHGCPHNITTMQTFLAEGFDNNFV